MIRKFGFMVGIGFLLCACTSTRTGDAQGQTHWLDACIGDNDCGELSCICGVCAASCAAGDGCSVAGHDTECFAASSDPVRAQCQTAKAEALCLEPCDGACGDGQRCVDGACIPEAGGAPRAGAGGKAGSGPSAGGGAGSGNPEGPEPTPAMIVLYNSTDRPYFLHVGANCSGIKDWFRVLDGSERVQVEGGCITDCATWDPSKGPTGCAAICRADEYATLQPGAEIAYDWDGAAWTNDPRGCQARTPVPEGTALELQFCWLDAIPTGDPFPGPPDPEDVHCESVPTILGEQAVIRHEIQN